MGQKCRLSVDSSLARMMCHAQVFNAVIGKMVTAVLWTSPVGIASLIAAAICRACSLLGTLSALVRVSTTAHGQCCGLVTLPAKVLTRAAFFLGQVPTRAAAAAQGLWVLTVLGGLCLFGLVALPAAFWALTRKRPTEVARGFGRALALAFGTSSSSAALPVRAQPSLLCDDLAMSGSAFRSCWALHAGRPAAHFFVLGSVLFLTSGALW